MGISVFVAYNIESIVDMLIVMKLKVVRTECVCASYFDCVETDFL